MARAHYENFPVASWLLPGAMRPHVAAVYAFARTADDFADEGRRSDAERLGLLDDWERRLHACVAAEQRDPDDQIFLAVGQTIRTCDLPVTLFEDLLSAFRQDITTHRYQTWAGLLDYCRRSANPVGRLVLRIAGYDDPRLDLASDALCTALQLTNFWQDLERDWQNGRLYVPLDDLDVCHAAVDDLSDQRMTEPWRCAMRRVARRTRELFEAGRPVCDGVSGRLRYELRLTWLGGMRVLARLERDGFNVFAARPALGAGDAFPLVAGMLAWKSSAARDGGRATR
jgi:phytoene synthase